jgi:hypothetical protein
MKRPELDRNCSPNLIALAAWLVQIGRSDTWGWRHIKAGHLHPLNIAGRPYLTGADIEQFLRRAAPGEFARPPSGAARRSAKTRTANLAGRERHVWRPDRR